MFFFFFFGVFGFDLNYIVVGNYDLNIYSYGGVVFNFNFMSVGSFNFGVLLVS